MSGIERTSDPEVGGVLREHINRFNKTTTGVWDWHPITFVVSDEHGELAGGVDGWEWGGTCYVDALWVRDDCRNQGIGSALMEAVETEARRLSCHQIALETHSFQAPAFYEHRGFRRVGEIDGYPGGHSLISLVKPLAQP